MKIKFIFMIMLFVFSILPSETFAFWGRKKKNIQSPPKDAYSILLQTNNTDNATNNTVVTQTTVVGYVPDALGRKPVKEGYKTAAQQLSYADNLRKHADKASDDDKYDIAVELYDKAVKAYSHLQNKYPDLQKSSIAFNKKHCVYRLGILLKGLRDGTIEFKETLPSQEKKPSSRAEDIVLKKACDLIEQGNNGAARELLMRALMNDPDNARIRIAIGVVQVKLQWYDDASFLLETLVSEHPENIDAHVVLAAAYTGLERYQDAVLQLQKTLALNSMHKEANFDMAKLLAKTAPQEKEKIRKYYTKAVKLGVDRDSQLDSFLR